MIGTYLYCILLSAMHLQITVWNIISMIPLFVSYFLQKWYSVCMSQSVYKNVTMLLGTHILLNSKKQFLFNVMQRCNCCSLTIPSQPGYLYLPLLPITSLWAILSKRTWSDTLGPLFLIFRFSVTLCHISFPICLMLLALFSLNTLNTHLLKPSLSDSLFSHLQSKLVQIHAIFTVTNVKFFLTFIIGEAYSALLFLSFLE